MKFIKHELSTDLCYQILNNDGTDLYLDTWNMGQTSAFPIGYQFSIPLIKILDEPWLMCENIKDILDNDKSFREAIWVKYEV